MQTIVITDIRLLRNKGRYYVHSAVESILRRYYQNFGFITVVSRVIELKRFDDKTLCDVTDIIGDTILLHSFLEFYNIKTRKKLTEKLKKCDLVIFRTPSILSCLAHNMVKKSNTVYMAESMGEAWASFWNHSILGKFIAPYVHLKNIKIFKYANYALYVTDMYLQRLYPCNCKCINASNVYINNCNENIIKKRLEKIKKLNFDNISIMTIAGVNVRAKGHKYVIEAMPKLIKNGINVHYYLVGGGNQEYLKKIAKKNKVEDFVIFLGQLSHEKVYEIIDKTDIYIQPSLQEGLPRSVIEAMSRGCPCFGARTAGIPELLPQECIFDRKSSDSIFHCLIENLNTNRLINYSTLEYKKSCEYESTILDKRRNEFFQTIKKEIKMDGENK